MDPSVLRAGHRHRNLSDFKLRLVELRRWRQMARSVVVSEHFRPTNVKGEGTRLGTVKSLSPRFMGACRSPMHNPKP